MLSVRMDANCEKEKRAFWKIDLALALFYKRVCELSRCEFIAKFQCDPAPPPTNHLRRGPQEVRIADVHKKSV